MSADVRWIVEVMPSGKGWVLDLEGGQGQLRNFAEQKTYRYMNLDVRAFENKEPTVIGSAHELPYQDETFDMVIRKDSLEHFFEPWCAIQEVCQVLKPGGWFIIWVLFLHPFHGDDTNRYTHLGLKYLLRDFTIVSIGAPLWVFSFVGMIVSSPLVRLGWHRPVDWFAVYVSGWMLFLSVGRLIHEAGAWLTGSMQRKKKINVQRHRFDTPIARKRCAARGANDEDALRWVQNR